MPSLLAIVFLLQLVIHLINTIGAPAINNLLWTIYNKLPTPTSTSVRSQADLRTQVVRLKREMNSTSSQDEFAKWAKLRRQHDKVLEQYEEKASSVQGFKATFDRTVTMARWIATNGLRLLLQFWFAKRPLFWVPRGLVPGHIEWLLAFPRAPRGSVSIQIWGIACATVVQLVGAAMVAAWVLMNSKQGEAQPRISMKADGGKREGKKEL